MTRVINDYARKNGLLKDADPNFSGDDTREGLTAIVAVKHPEPQFESQTKVKLMNPEVQTYSQQIIGEAFGTFLDENPQAAKAIIAKCLTSARGTRCSQEGARSGHPQVGARIFNIARQVGGLFRTRFNEDGIVYCGR